jgi:hypothetical protein
MEIRPTATYETYIEEAADSHDTMLLPMSARKTPSAMTDWMALKRPKAFILKKILREFTVSTKNVLVNA